MGLKDTFSGPLGYLLWCCGSRSQDFFNFIQIGSAHWEGLELNSIIPTSFELWFTQNSQGQFLTLFCTKKCGWVTDSQKLCNRPVFLIFRFKLKSNHWFLTLLHFFLFLKQGQRSQIRKCSLFWYLVLQSLTFNFAKCLSGVTFRWK